MCRADGVGRTYADGCISTVVLWMAILDSGWNPCSGDPAAAAATAASNITRAAAAAATSLRLAMGIRSGYYLANKPAGGDA
nr:unnamed protein product [Digitaria exilis]